MCCATRPLQRALLLFLCGSCFLDTAWPLLGKGEGLLIGVKQRRVLFYRIDAVKSKYVCQGERLRLRCGENYILRIYGAKYGRLEPGSSICPHPNITNLNCQAPNVLLKMTVKCSNRHRCTVRADHTVFGDPCPGTFKYLDVIYECKNFNVTTGSNISSISIPTITSTTRSWRRRLTTWTTEQTKSPPKAPESKASGRPDRPRDTLVVFLSGVAGATVFLLLFLLASRVCKRQRRKRKFSLEKKKREEQDEGNKIKSVTIEIQGSDDETKEINVNPGDIIIIDHNDVNRPGSEDLGYLSEIVRFYNSQNIGSDDQISIRKQFSTCDSPSVISTEASESRDSKYGSVGTKQCTCRHDSLLRPSSPLSII
ncbi:carbohydrate binding [Desmophyllum pertusum]|uniref:Carbohydrate binding n=1 Tax=Desmophyllum pertusum TaxID=174260 RepID=A0A9X0A8E8_9CNID|nr:carbohydrate binding [Desmophyllum pertusum]